MQRFNRASVFLYAILLLCVLFSSNPEIVFSKQPVPAVVGKMVNILQQRGLSVPESMKLFREAARTYESVLSLTSSNTRTFEDLFIAAHQQIIDQVQANKQIRWKEPTEAIREFYREMKAFPSPESQIILRSFQTIQAGQAQFSQEHHKLLDDACIEIEKALQHERENQTLPSISFQPILPVENNILLMYQQLIDACAAIKHAASSF